MTKMKGNEARIRTEEALLNDVLSSMPANPIDWMAMVKIVSPIVARLAVRYALKRARRNMSEAKVLAVSNSVSGLIRSILGVSPPLKGTNEGQ